MPELDFRVEHAAAVPFATVPQIGFGVRIAETSGVPIRSVLLHAQMRIEPAHRPDAERHAASLLDLVGTPDRWGTALTTMLWTHVQTIVPAFVRETAIELPVPCSFDFDVAATKSVEALSAGGIPLRFLFSGIVFYEDAVRGLQTSPIAWDREAEFRLPLDAWRALSDAYYPDTAWLRLRRDVFADLLRFKTRAGIPTWEQTLARLLSAASEEPAATP